MLIIDDYLLENIELGFNAEHDKVIVSNVNLNDLQDSTYLRILTIFIDLRERTEPTIL